MENRTNSIWTEHDPTTGQNRRIMTAARGGAKVQIKPHSRELCARAQTKNVNYNKTPPLPSESREFVLFLVFFFVFCFLFFPYAAVRFPGKYHSRGVRFTSIAPPPLLGNRFYYCFRYETCVCRRSRIFFFSLESPAGRIITRSIIVRFGVRTPFFFFLLLTVLIEIKTRSPCARGFFRFLVDLESLYFFFCFFSYPPRLGN